jgi:hypothetical protein
VSPKQEISGEGVRVNVTAKDSQMIADLLGCLLPTAKIADLLYEQADIRILPKTMSYPSQDLRHMADTSWMIDHSHRIDMSFPEKATTPELTDFEWKLMSPYITELAPLVSTVGKHWIIDQCLVAHSKSTAANYGWHFPGSTYGGLKGSLRVIGKGRLIQGIGTRHNNDHTDYSQTCQLVFERCLVDGNLMLVKDVLADKTLHSLGTHNGPMTYLRQYYT